ncbi:hypothetical protein B0T18DRAFT_404535 [Schizothecium vesticola]|uniref:Secreted protein n=1 Tax=Schizothecium vesticola TaxID=314040 RepID=A0AA40F758_9PEZI|nr:hypothetical protein B0T18DRAFT_404535 [Schizothecium vesticola]
MLLSVGWGSLLCFGVGGWMLSMGDGVGKADGEVGLPCCSLPFRSLPRGLGVASWGVSAVAGTEDDGGMDYWCCQCRHMFVAGGRYSCFWSWWVTKCRCDNLRVASKQTPLIATFDE